MKKFVKFNGFGKILLLISVLALVIPLCLSISSCDSSKKRPSGYVTDHTSIIEGPVKEDWLVRYYRSGTDWDSAQKIAVDSSGNIYVLGRVNEDIAVIKYDSGGEQQWLARFDINSPICWGNTQLSERCIGDMAVDDSDNIYITAGGDKEERSPHGYLTIMYDLEGNEIRVAQYVSAEYNYDWSNALAVDNDGNVFVTGSSSVNGNLANYDYATVKYDGNGNQLWGARYGLAGEQRCYAKALAIDSVGNVYVTGACGTVKYDSEGRQLWSTPCDSAEGCVNSASALALDSSGNLYVTGQSGTIKYDGDGNRLWRVDYTPVEYEHYHKWDITLDKSDNAYIIGPNVVGNSNGYSVVKYDADGVQHWSRQHVDPNALKSKFIEVLTDEYGNVYVAGHDFGFVTVKYDGDGNQLWVARGYNKDTCIDWEVSDIALDGSGSIYVVGTAIRQDEWCRKDEQYRMIIARYVQY